ncbi:T9SS type A sorting domain-containing protein [Marinilabilia rubra]|uniref:Secretion system C-terminal sorting domain-containing protein n=1 Tax=Marinilabilia rubra TaxID=2162893 RepID=A0A2U2BAQ0_9BACT|nr:T9SS type A sorting domain-containing protein [Marinilabilia rubra]PWE00142.1 hypothetical protein DDZ16_07245 [Marinilabilia rubra]
MKQSLLRFSLILSFSIIIVSIHAQSPIANGGFETWEDVALLSGPDNWNIEKDHEAGSLVNYQVADATEGSSSIRLVTMDDPGGESYTYSGYAIQGEVNQTGAAGGIPWTEDVDQLVCDVKYDIQTGDDALILVVAYNNGSEIGGGQLLINGTESSWSSLYVDLTLSGTPTELFVGFTSSNFEGTPIDGSWLQVDNVRLFNNGSEVGTTLPNFSFETWSDITINDPESWSSTNMELSEDNVTNVEPTTNAYSGTYAAQLTNVQMDGYVMTGGLTYGDEPWDGKTAYNEKPRLLTGAYNYTPVGDDMARIYVNFYDSEDMGVAGALVDIDATTGYETFVLPIYWNPANNDPVSTSVGVSAGESQVAGSVLLVDELNFENGSEVTFTVHDGGDPEPTYISGANIEIETYAGSTVTTDQNGSFFMYLPDGVYDITVTHPDYDTYTGTIDITGNTDPVVVMSVATDIHSIQNETFSVFPNPASERLFFSNHEEIESLKIITLNGMVVEKIIPAQGANSIDISHLLPGKYIVSLITRKGMVNRQIVISR